MKYSLSLSANEILSQLPVGAGLIVFDSFCVLCSSTVNLLTKIDRKRKLYYASFDTLIGEQLSGIIPNMPDSLIFYREGYIYLQSEAIVMIIKTLGYPWKAFSVIKYIPYKLRELMYSFVARIRYRVFGRKTKCKIPSPDVANRFLK